MNFKVQQLYKEAEVKEQGTTVNKHRKIEGGWKITAVAVGAILLWYAALTIF